MVEYPCYPAILLPDYANLYSELGDSPDSDLPTLISKYSERAVTEQLEGCFGLAEVCWKRATDLAWKVFPSKATAQVVKSLVAFLNRFLPKSAQSIVYLRTFLDMQTSFDPRSEDVLEARLLLANSLMTADYCEEAESLLTVIKDTEKGEASLRSAVYLGRIKLVLGDVTAAEAMLKATIATIRGVAPSGELLAEALTLLGETLLESEKYQECEQVLEEALRLSQPTLSEVFFRGLGFLASTLRATKQYDKLDLQFSSLLSVLKQARPYVVAEVLTIWGDGYTPPGNTALQLNEEAALHYLQALSVYRSVRPVSLYVLRVLRRLVHRLAHSTERQWINQLIPAAEKQFFALLKQVPLVSTLLSVAFPSYSEQYMCKLDELARKDEVVAEEARWDVVQHSQVCLVNTDTRKHYLARNTSSKLGAQMCVVFAREAVQIQSLKTLKSLHLSPSFLLPLLTSVYASSLTSESNRAYVEEELSLATAAIPNSYSTAVMCSRLAAMSSLKGDVQEEAYLHRCLRIVEGINPQSSWTEDVLRKLGLLYKKRGRMNEAEACLRRATELSFSRREFDYDNIRSLFWLYWSKKETNEQDLLLVAFFTALKRAKAVSTDHCAFVNSLVRMRRLFTCDHYLKTVLAYYVDLHFDCGTVTALETELQQFFRFDERTLGKMRDERKTVVVGPLLNRIEAVYLKGSQFGKAEAICVKAVTIQPLIKETAQSIRKCY